jgi:RNA polymerase sigma-70 factor (ECF subfamily)
MEYPSSVVDEEACNIAAEETVAALVTTYAATLYRVAFSVLRNAADAEDAVQEAFLRVLRHKDRLDEVRDRRVWLIRIVWNVVLDRKRRMKTRPETDDVAELARVIPWQGLSAEELAAAAQHHARVLGCVDRLPEKERQVLVGHYRIERAVAAFSRAKPAGGNAGSCADCSSAAGCGRRATEDRSGRG